MFEGGGGGRGGGEGSTLHILHIQYLKLYQTINIFFIKFPLILKSLEIENAFKTSFPIIKVRIDKKKKKKKKKKR